MKSLSFELALCILSTLFSVITCATAVHWKSKSLLLSSFAHFSVFFSSLLLLISTQHFFKYSHFLFFIGFTSYSYFFVRFIFSLFQKEWLKKQITIFILIVLLVTFIRFLLSKNDTSTPLFSIMVVNILLTAVLVKILYIQEQFTLFASTRTIVSICHIVSIPLAIFSLILPTAFPIAIFIIYSTVLWYTSSVLFFSLFQINLHLTDIGELEKTVRSDKLTGVFNRYALDRTLDTELDRQDRYATPLSFIMFDLDKFKRVNDTLGHDAGDIILKETARRVKNGIRETDRLFRWGGEEFMILLPHTTLQGAASLAEKLRVIICSSPMPPAGIISASFGVTERITGENRDTCFRRVDQALYSAKKKGRNRVEKLVSSHKKSEYTHITWQASWLTGNETIDQEHQQILEIGNTLLHISLTNAPENRLEEQLETLLKAIELHFKNEESILIEIKYDEYASHKKTHHKIMDEIKLIRKKYANGEIDATLLYHYIISTIVIDHTIKDDGKFKPMFNASKMPV